MALSKIYQPYTRLGHLEADGLINVLEREIAERGENGETSTPYYVGAMTAIKILRYHEFIDVPDDFLNLFDHYIND